VRHALAFLGAFALVVPASASGVSERSTDPRTPIKHFIVLMQENHSFDNYFGTYPGADGLPKGTCVPVDPGRPGRSCIRPFHIGDNNVQPADLDHSLATYKSQYDHGRLDGFVYALNLRNQDGRLALGHYDARDLPYHWNVADRYVLFDRFFSSAGAGSFMNHMYWVTGRGGERDRIPKDGYTVPTIFDRLEARGISWKFYVQNYEPRLTYRTLRQFPPNRTSQVVWVPLLNFDRFIEDPRLASHIVDLSEYFEDLHRGTLPAVAYIAPSGPSEHPPSSLASGQAFVRTLMTSLMESPYWKSSAFLYAYDDWGGWYDHVRPPRVDANGYGFRVPALLVSPYARRGVIDHTRLDFTSILAFIEHNWRIPPLAARDARAKTFLDAFDFSAPARPAVLIPAKRGPAAAAQKRHADVIIYAGYGLALASVVALLAAAAAHGLRQRTRRKAHETAW
jgi:phospholipase C